MIGRLTNGLEKESMFSNYQYNRRTKYSHLAEHKKTAKKVKQKTRIVLPTPQLKPRLLSNN